MLFITPAHVSVRVSAAAAVSPSDSCAAWSSAHAAGRFLAVIVVALVFLGYEGLNFRNDILAFRKLLPEKPLAKLLRLIHGQPVVRAVPWVKADDGVMALDIRPECFSFSLPLLQFQKRVLASSANKAFAINRPVRFSPLLRSGVGDLAKPDTKNGQDFRLAQSAQAISSSLFNLNTSQMSLIRS